jgi:hypothetical protein
MKAHKLSVVWAGLIGALVVAGCTTQPRRVSCDEQLQPINAPAGKVAQLPEMKPSPPTSTGQGQR